MDCCDEAGVVSSKGVDASVLPSGMDWKVGSEEGGEAGVFKAWIDGGETVFRKAEGISSKTKQIF